MMKRTLLAIVLFNLGIQLNAQRFDWATSGGYIGINNSFNGAIDIAIDPDGNLYTVDFANGDQTCQGQTFENFDSYTAFVYKFNSDGELLLVNRIGGVSGDFYPYNIECDDEGSLYVLGQPNGILELNINGNIVSAVGNTNQLIKFNADGVFQWKINTGFAGNGQGSMLQYHDGYVYYQSGALTVSKISTEGVIPSETLSASYYNTSVASSGPVYKGSGVFSNGDLLFAAYSWGTVAFGEDTLFHTGNPALTAPFLFVRCAQDMSVVWAQFASNGRNPDKNTIPVAIDDSDNVYACVQVNQEMTIGTDVITNPNNTFIGVGSIIKFDSNGVGQWGKPLDESLSAFGWCMDKAEDGSKIMIGGGYSQTPIFGDFTLPFGNGLPFLAKINADGEIENAFNYLQQPLQTDAISLKRAGNGRYYVGGKLANSTDPVFSCNTIDGFAGFYLGKISEQPDIVPQPVISQVGDVLTASPAFEGEIQWLLNGEPIDGANGQSYTVTQSGNYGVTYEYTTGCVGTATSDVVVVEIIGVPELNDRNLNVYPNPMRDFFTISAQDGKHGEMKIEVMNLLGDLLLVQEKYTSGRMIDSMSLSKGVYFIRITMNSGVVETHRLVKE